MMIEWMRTLLVAQESQLPDPLRWLNYRHRPVQSEKTFLNECLVYLRSPVLVK